MAICWNELSSWLSVCAVLLHAVLIACIPLPFGVWDRMWNHCNSVFSHMFNLYCTSIYSKGPLLHYIHYGACSKSKLFKLNPWSSSELIRRTKTCRAYDLEKCMELSQRVHVCRFVKLCCLVMIVLLFACTVNASALFKNASPAKAFGRSSDCNQTSYLKIAKLQCFLWLSLLGHYGATDEALLAKTK